MKTSWGLEKNKTKIRVSSSGEKAKNERRQEITVGRVALVGCQADPLSPHS
jgi:hypothetical protein